MTIKIQIVRFSIIKLYGVSKVKQQYTVKFNRTELKETMFIVILVDNIYSFSFCLIEKYPVMVYLMSILYSTMQCIL